MSTAKSTIRSASATAIAKKFRIATDLIENSAGDAHKEFLGICILLRQAERLPIRTNTSIKVNDRIDLHFEVHQPRTAGNDLMREVA